MQAAKTLINVCIMQPDLDFTAQHTEYLKSEDSILLFNRNL